MRCLALLLLCALATWSAPPDTTRRTVWLDVSTPQGSDIADWTQAQAEQAFSSEPGFKVISRAQREEEARRLALQPITRHADADSALRSKLRPDFWVELKLEPLRATDGRAGFLFFMGRREVHAAMNFSVRSDKGDMPPLQGRLMLDTSWILDYCGMLECVNTPFPAVQRLPIERALVLRTLDVMHERLRQALVIPRLEKNRIKADSLRADSLRRAAPQASQVSADRDSTKPAKPNPSPGTPVPGVAPVDSAAVVKEKLKP